MNKKFFFPAPVEVVKVTVKNLEEVADWCGGKVAKVESRRVPGRMDSYVWVPTPKGTKISWAFPGMYITKRVVVTLQNELKTTYSVFRRDYFEKNYFETPNEAVDATWGRKDNPKKAEKPDVVVNITASGVDEVQAQINEVKEQVMKMAKAAGIELNPDETAAAVEVHTQLGIKSIELGEVEKEPIGEVEEKGVMTFHHDHVMEVKCGDRPCGDNRYLDGVHVFTDVTVDADDKGWRTTTLQEKPYVKLREEQKKVVAEANAEDEDENVIRG